MGGTTADGTIYYRHGKDEPWQECDGNAVKIAVSRHGHKVVCVNSDNMIYIRDGFDGAWEQVEGALCDIAISSDGKEILGTNGDGDIYHRDIHHGGDWTQLDGNAVCICFNDGDSNMVNAIW